jgi:hypothetical protein
MPILGCITEEEKKPEIRLHSMKKRLITRNLAALPATYSD